LTPGWDWRLGAAPYMQHFSPYTALHEHASRKPDADAIVTEDATVTYGEFAERVVAFASWLLYQGLIQGEVTGICIRDEIGHLVCAMALLCLDTPHMSLGSHENAATKRALARKVGVTQLVVEKSDDWMGDLRTIVAAPRDPKAVFTAPRVTASSVFRGRTLDSIAVYQNTSGSTNVPKTFGLTLERLLLLANRYVIDPREQRVLRTGSIETDAHRLHRICSLIAGNTGVFLRHVNLPNLVALCERAAVSSIVMGAYKLASLLHSERRECGRLPSFTAIVTGGARVPGALRKELRAALTKNLWVLYATSEVGMISLATPDQHEAFPEGVGFPPTEATVEIVGPNGDILGPAEIGQIRIRKAGMVSRYVSEPSAFSNFRDGWFYPGDLLSCSEGGPLIFHGRADDMMILNGLNIFPSAIEDTLESHPDVQEAVAYPIKSRIYGEIPVAAVVLSANTQNRGTTHLLDHCRQSLGMRGPRQILIVESIPRNQAGKPLRRELARS
jgi:acyl-CoA synthetase (AMP-forming)/AMP-acid ligase II